MRERKTRGEGSGRRRKKPPRVTRPTLRNKNSLYGELLLRVLRFFCIPLDTRYSAFQSVQRIHSSPMVSLGIPHSSLFFFFFLNNYLPFPPIFSFRLLFVSLLLIPLAVFAQQTKHLKRSFTKLRTFSRSLTVLFLVYNENF